ncbi:hypothetical protein GQ53DRAFT_632199 [Thozetella sp. PMI_491]|nr:hypothetical protein GQ53DRAFT_632199 [Thozetella sp. PMI_491]
MATEHPLGERSPSVPYPDIADTSHATPSLVNFFRGYFTAKSAHDAPGLASYFDPTNATYADAVLGSAFSQPDMAATFAYVASTWGPDSKSYPLRIIGDMNGAVIMFRNTPDMFGAELLSIAAVDFKGGKIVRQVDYWDGRRNPVADSRVPDDQYPADFGEKKFRVCPNRVLQSVVDQLHAALSAGNGSGAVALFTADAVLEERTARSRIEGQLAIERYLERALASLPYGSGSTVRHVVGSGQGGGYEWVGKSGAAARNGLTALELDQRGKITRLTTAWDASRADDANIKALTELAIEE